MIKNYKFKKYMLLFICLLSISSICGCNKKENEITIGSIDKNKVSKIEIENIIGEQKEIKNKSEIVKIIELINSIKIEKYNIEPRDGCGYTVKIKYFNGKNFSANFLSNTVAYSVGNKKAICGSINKNIVDDLRKYYDEN